MLQLSNFRSERRKSTAAATLATLRRESLTALSQRRDSQVPVEPALSQTGETVVADTIVEEEEGQALKSVTGGDDLCVPDLPPAGKNQTSWRKLARKCLLSVLQNFRPIITILVFIS